VNINISARAKNRIAQLCTNQQKVRLSIDAGGCQGFNKVWNTTDTLEPDDVLFECNSGHLVIDSISLELISDATIDYVNDLNGSYFKVEIPGAVSTCGCGSSFSI
jgi:iron-sulfur cluster insertion protein